jgi:hypothetical protein
MAQAGAGARPGHAGQPVMQTLQVGPNDGALRRSMLPWRRRCSGNQRDNGSTGACGSPHDLQTSLAPRLAPESRGVPGLCPVPAPPGHRAAGRTPPLPGPHDLGRDPIRAKHRDRARLAAPPGHRRVSALDQPSAALILALVSQCRTIRSSRLGRPDSGLIHRQPLDLNAVGSLDTTSPCMATCPRSSRRRSHSIECRRSRRGWRQPAPSCTWLTRCGPAREHRATHARGDRLWSGAAH